MVDSGAVVVPEILQFLLELGGFLRDLDRESRAQIFDFGFLVVDEFFHRQAVFVLQVFDFLLVVFAYFFYLGAVPRRFEIAAAG